MTTRHKKKGLAKSIAMVLSIGISGTVLAKELPVYQVIANGMEPERGYALAESLGIDPKHLEREALAKYGEVKYLDAEHFQHVPTITMGSEKSDEDYNEVVAEALDFEAIKQMKAVDQDRVMRFFQDALYNLELNPEVYKPKASNTEFSAEDAEGNPIVDALIDTTATLNLYLNDVPLVGPGAKVAFTMGADGKPTQLQYSMRQLAAGEMVPVIENFEARERCAKRYLASNKDINAEDLELDVGLVYYAPELSSPGVETIQPHYTCGGTARVGDEIVHLLRELIPAVDNQEYVPSVALQPQSIDNMVHARVDIRGGLPPYRVEWSAKHPRINDRAGHSISYPLRQRSPSSVESVVATVTDANGIQVVVSQDIAVASKPAFKTPVLIRDLGRRLSGLLDGVISPVQAVGGVSDYGTENAVTNEFGDLEQGFIDRMQSAGIVERFSWSGMNAWEQDFKAPEDSDWIDNTDITFYVGHGYGGGFTFENTSNDDGTLDHDDATEDWGDKDLEWLALLSCQVLKDDWSGMSRFDRWKQEFDGLHMLLGFHTNAYAWSSFSGEFADNMLKSSPMSVRQAWFSATDTNQPNHVQPVVMGVFRNDGVSNMNDHFWGKGSVGPDIRDGDIGGYWSIKML